VNVEALYQEALLRLARAGVGAGRLEAPDGRAERDNPLCGDEVAFDVRLGGDRIAALAHRVRGCVLCQAAASVLGSAGIGRTAAELATAQAAVVAMLEAGGAVPGEPWTAMAAFQPVRAVPSRHRCVLLPFEALAEAVASATR
jgi:NifU-like protein involved in Fe-S cluster formation